MRASILGEVDGATAVENSGRALSCNWCNYGNLGGHQEEQEMN